MPEEFIEGLTARSQRMVSVCNRRRWDLRWESRAAHLHLEASELIEALRNKRGDPCEEAGDVLAVLMSIVARNHLDWAEIIRRLDDKLSKLEVSGRYSGEAYLEDGFEP